MTSSLIVPRASNFSALADISYAQGRQLSYQYQQKTSELDGIFDCLHYHFRSGIQLTRAEKRVPALAMDFELRQWQAAQSFFISQGEDEGDARRGELQFGAGHVARCQG